MEMKLNIYDGGKVIRTYTAEDVVLTTGIIEDVLEEVNIDTLLSGNVGEREMSAEILKIVCKSFRKFKPFILETFKGMNDEEYRMTSVKEVSKCILDIVNYAIQELLTVDTSKKKAN